MKNGFSPEVKVIIITSVIMKTLLHEGAQMNCRQLRTFDILALVKRLKSAY